MAKFQILLNFLLLKDKDMLKDKQDRNSKTCEYYILQYYNYSVKFQYIRNFLIAAIYVQLPASGFEIICL